MKTSIYRLFFIVCLLGTIHAAARESQTVIFPPIPTQSTTNPIFVLNATASSGLGITYRVTAGGNIAKVSGNIVTLTGVPGPVTIRANQWGNAQYAPSPAVCQDFTVVKNLAGSPPWRSIAYGSGTVFGVKNDGTLWAWGYNINGSLGDGTNVNKLVPEQIGTDTNWQTVSANHQTVALKTDGSLWTWGYNFYGELGLGTQVNTNLPQQVGNATWNAIAAGYGYTMAIRADGTLWESGTGIDLDRTGSFTQVGTDTNWSFASASDSHAMIIKTNGTLWGLGDNSSGNLGTGGFGPITTVPVQAGSDTNWKSVSAGHYYTAAIKTDGTLWTWGANNEYELGNGGYSPFSETNPTQVGAAMNWQTVSTGIVDCVALKTDGTLWAWGDNQAGEVGDGTISPRGSPEQIGTDTNWQLAAGGSFATIATKSDGTFWEWGSGSYPNHGLRPVDSQLGSVIAYSGINDVLAIKSDHTLWAWGENQSGQLGDGTTTTKKNPEQIGSASNWASVSAAGTHTLAVKTDGTLWGWGSNSPYGELGDGTTTDRLTPERIGLDTHWKSVSTNYQSTLAIKTDGTLWAWGNSYFGQLGLGPAVPPYRIVNPTEVSGAVNWQSVSVGDQFTVAIRTDGTLWSWGQNQYGQLGNGTTTPTNFPQMVGTDTHWLAASAGAVSVVALKTDGTLWTWGSNASGQLGSATMSVQSTPAQITRAKTWTKVVNCNDHVLATMADGSLWAWGSNQLGELNDGTLIQRNYPEQINKSAKWSLAANEGMSSALFSLASTKEGTLWGWGDDSSYALVNAAIDASVPQRVIPGISPVYLGIPAITAQIGVPVELYANAASELPVTFSASGPATLVDHTLTVTGPGTVNLIGYQLGDENWGATGPASVPVTVSGP